MRRDAEERMWQTVEKRNSETVQVREEKVLMDWRWEQGCRNCRKGRKKGFLSYTEFRPTFDPLPPPACEYQPRNCTSVFLCVHPPSATFDQLPSVHYFSTYQLYHPFPTYWPHFFLPLFRLDEKNSMSFLIFHSLSKGVGIFNYKFFFGVNQGR